ncbi:MAG: nucleotidyltransferase family protein [Methylovirgula sp.]
MSELNSLVIPIDGTIHGAMEAISANGRQVVLVRDKEGRIAGLITDGDIRRGLLRGLDFNSPVRDVMNRDFVSVSPEADRAMVLDLMRARSIQHVPALDSEGRLAAVHFLSSLLGVEAKPNAAIIMAGGKGTRLRPLTTTIPKPMIQVAGRPILERIVLHLVGHGIQRIYLAVNFLAEKIEQHFGDGSAFGCHIEYLRESVPLGTGGPLALLPQPIYHPVVVLNGDQITQINITHLIEAHALSDAVATLVVGPHHVEIPFATVTTQENKLVALEEKPTLNFLVNRGIYVLDPEVISLVPRDQEFPITDLFSQLIFEKRPVGVYYTDDDWIDVGRPDDLRRARGTT